MEESGANRLLIETITKLYGVPSKPENPIEWFRLYFKTLVPDSSKEQREIEESLAFELAEAESLMKTVLEEEARSEAFIKKLEQTLKTKAILGQLSKKSDDERTTRRSGGICTDAFPTTLPSDDEKHFEGLKDGAEGSSRENHKMLRNKSLVPSSSNEYNDYPTIYFPEQMRKLTEVEEDPKEEEQEELEYGGDYDAESEGGEESEQYA